MEILNTNECSATLEAIISDASKYVIIISPYIQLTPRIESLLEMAGNRDVPIFLVTRERLKKEEYNKVKGIKTLSMIIHPPLHAKVYFNEEEVLISSLNLYDFSQQNNTEIGVVFWRKEEKKEYQVLTKHFLDIMEDKRSEMPVAKLDDKQLKRFEKALNGSWF